MPNLFQRKKYVINKSSTEGKNLFENIVSKTKNSNKDLINIKIDDEKDNFLDFDFDTLNKEEKSNYEEKYTKNKNPFKENIYYDKDKIKY